MIKPWQKIGSTPSGDFRIFTIRTDRMRSPRTGDEHDFYIIETVDFVNVIGVTPDNQIVMVQQYRHGSKTVELEIPGGMMDAEDISPVEAGVREFREETGYEGTKAQLIGQVFANPAIMSNTCFTVLIENCVAKHETVFDHTEDLVTQLVPADAIPDLVRNGRIQHSLVVVALYHFELWRREKGA